MHKVTPKFIIRNIDFRALDLDSIPNMHIIEKTVVQAKSIHAATYFQWKGYYKPCFLAQALTYLDSDDFAELLLL